MEPSIFPHRSTYGGASPIPTTASGTASRANLNPRAHVKVKPFDHVRLYAAIRERPLGRHTPDTATPSRL